MHGHKRVARSGRVIGSSSCSVTLVWKTSEQLLYAHATALSQTSSFLDRFSREFWISNKSYITVINHPVLPWYVYTLIIKMVCFWLLFFKVNVVSFNTEASTEGGSDVTSCFSERLALAVPENKKSLKKYIEGPKFIAHRKSIVMVINSYFHYHVLPRQAP